MNLKQRIQEEMKVAMKAKDQAALRALRAIKSAILLAETAEGRSPGDLSPEEEMKLLTKQAKQRRDSATQYRENNRDDLAITEEEELEVIERFLPEQMSQADVEAAVAAIISETGAQGIKDMGKVMGIATQKLAGKADGKVISAAARKILM